MTNTYKIRALSALALALFAVGACGGGTERTNFAANEGTVRQTVPTAPTTTLPPLDLDACALVTLEEARRITGAPLERIPNQAPASCKYDVPSAAQSPTRPNISEVRITVEREPNAAASLRTLFAREPSEKIEKVEVPGIGDFAFRTVVDGLPLEIDVAKGDLVLTILVMAQFDNDRMQEEAARIAVARL